MRGVSAIPFPPPVGGWRTDSPVYLIPPDALSDGLNVVVDLNGQLQPRRGYEPLPAQPDASGTDPDDPRIVGGISWSGDDSQLLVVATLGHWWFYDGAAFMEITGGLLDGDPAVPTRFAQFGFVNGAAALYGVNGTAHGLLRRWIVTDPVTMAAPIVDEVHGGLSFAAADLAVVANRLVAVALTERGQLLSQRVRWSSVNDGGSWPTLAFADLLGDAGNLIAIQLASRTTAVLYCQNGAWIMSATQGDDASAFVFDRLQGAYAAPVSPSAICNIGGQHYYLATDGHVWRCTGQSAQPISEAIDAGLFLLLARGHDQIVSTLYDASRLRIWFFCTFVNDNGQPRSAIPYYLTTGAWGVPQRFADAVTTAFPVIEQMGPTWDNPGEDSSGQTYTWDSAPWASWDAIPESYAPAMYIGLGNGLVCRYGLATTDNGEPIAYRAVYGLRSPESATDRLEVNAAEVYLAPLSSAPVELNLEMLRTPYDPAAVPILSVQIPQDQPADWLVRLSPDPTTPGGAFRMGNLLRLTLSGESNDGYPLVAGSVAYAFVTKRPDIQYNVTDNF